MLGVNLACESGKDGTGSSFEADLMNEHRLEEIRISGPIDIPVPYRLSVPNIGAKDRRCQPMRVGASGKPAREQFVRLRLDSQRPRPHAFSLRSELPRRAGSAQ